jgi:spore coat protein U-like protein
MDAPTNQAFAVKESSMRSVFKAAAAAAGILAIAGSAQAATVSSSIGVSAVLGKVCTVSATNINFGTYTPGGGALTGNSTISVKCTKSTTYTVALNAGTTTGGAFSQRLMAYGTENLQYNLYTTAGFATVFGDGTAGTGTGSGTGTGLGAAAQTYTAFGQLVDSTANQNAAPNAVATTYSDTVTVTVTY